MADKFSCIIASYNENPRILKVLDVVNKVKSISEIICVDDGSIDNTAQIAKAHFPNIQVAIHTSNKGKVEAIRTGLEASINDSLLLLDSDLVGLKTEEIEKALSVFRNNKIDCLIMLTRADKYNRLVRKIFKGTSYVAGNRVIRKEILSNILEDKTLYGYGLEVAENKYLFKHKCSIARFQLSATDLGKIFKYGLIKGTIGEIKMWKEIFSSVGTGFFLEQKKLFKKVRYFN